MDWLGLTEEHKLLRKEIAAFAKKEVAPLVDQVNESVVPTQEIIKKLANMGLCSILIPESLGGAQMDHVCLIITLEELAAVSPSIALSLAMQNVIGVACEKLKDEKVKQNIVPKLTEASIFGSVSIVNGTFSGTKNEENNVIISGQSPFMVNGKFSNCSLLEVVIDDRQSFVYHNNFDKSKSSSQENLLGFCQSGITSYTLNDQHVEHFFVLDDSVYDQLWRLLQLCFASVALGICQGCLDKSNTYAQERYQFGQTIACFGMVQRLLKEIANACNTTRVALYCAAESYNTMSSEEFLRLCASARQAAMTASDNAVQIFGGYGYTKEYDVEMFFRDAKFLEALPPSVTEIFGRVAD